MSVTAKKSMLRSDVVHCKASREDLSLPGDYAFMNLDGKRVVVLQCPCCVKAMLLEKATIVRDEPLSLLPTLECFCGGLYRIHEGRIIAA